MKFFHDLTPSERAILKKLSTPGKIQNYLDKLPMNFSDDDPCFCPRDVMKYKTAHCMEGALFAALAVWYHGGKPLLLDLTTTVGDEDHVVALFKQNGYWGAVSKTNHGVLRFRDPVYKTVRELAMSYFNEYFLDSGKKTMRTFSAPFDLSKHMNLDWITSRENIMKLIDKLNDSKHYDVAPKKIMRNLRKADMVEIKAGKVVEWRRKK